MKFRDKNIFTFLYSNGNSSLMWLTLSFGILIIFGARVVEITQSYSPFASLFFLIGYVSLYIMFNFYNYYQYKIGKDLAKDLNNEILETFENHKVYVKNYDISQLQNKYGLNYGVTIYDFDKGDIILTENALILLGYGLPGIVNGYANPIEILFKGKPLTSNYATLTNTPIYSNNSILLQIDDKNYKNNLSIKLESNEKLTLWSKDTWQNRENFEKENV